MKPIGTDAKDGGCVEALLLDSRGGCGLAAEARNCMHIANFQLTQTHRQTHVYIRKAQNVEQTTDLVPLVAKSQNYHC